VVRFWCGFGAVLGYYVTIPLTNEETFLSPATKFTATWPTSARTAERGSPLREHNGDTTKVVDFYLRRHLVRGASYADLSA